MQCLTVAAIGNESSEAISNVRRIFDTSGNDTRLYLPYRVLLGVQRSLLLHHNYVQVIDYWLFVDGTVDFYYTLKDC